MQGRDADVARRYCAEQSRDVRVADRGAGSTVYSSGGVLLLLAMLLFCLAVLLPLGSIWLHLPLLLALCSGSWRWRMG